MIHTYSEANAYLGEKRDRPLPGRSTRIYREQNGSIAVYYHSTPVVSYFPDGAVRLNSGKYHTVTTKTRINTYSHANVWQRDFHWYVADPAGIVHNFEDGYTLQPTAGIS